MVLQLEELERQNQADCLMTNSQLAEALVGYFDDYGTPNERVRAHYILGRTWADLGEAPRAIEAYLDAAECADTTSSDCDYAKLSRVHAQSALLYDQFVQPRSELEELRLAQQLAWKASDTLMAIECFAQEANAYDLLKLYDSVIVVKEKAAMLYSSIGRKDMAAQTLGTAVSAAVAIGKLDKAERFVSEYETYSGLFDEKGYIEEGREIYYYIKGQYYLSIGLLDSAEAMFRREQSLGQDINDQIACSRGLMELYEARGVKDSMAKYANLSYQLNDSAYLLSEMENLQRLRVSYDYSRSRLMAEIMEKEAKQAQNRFLAVAVVLLIVSLAFAFYYWKKREQHLEYRRVKDMLEKAQTELMELRSGEGNEPPMEFIEKKKSEIVAFHKRLTDMNESLTQLSPEDIEKRMRDSKVVRCLKRKTLDNPPVMASDEDMKELRSLVNELIPSFYDKMNEKETLRQAEYNISVLVRAYFQPSEISKLLDMSDSHVANIRSRLFRKLTGKSGSPSDLDCLVRSYT